MKCCFKVYDYYAVPINFLRVSDLQSSLQRHLSKCFLFKKNQNELVQQLNFLSFLKRLHIWKKLIFSVDRQLKLSNKFPNFSAIEHCLILNLCYVDSKEKMIYGNGK